jgi:nicotinamidase-related amidase
MSNLNLNVRYYQDSTPADVPCREEHFIHREINMGLPVDQTALVLVDLWDVHFIESWVERARRITHEAIVPAIEAAREAGLTIIHAPSPEVAGKFPQATRNPKVPTPPPPAGPAWPPEAFRRREDAYGAFANPRDQPPGIGVHWDSMKSDLSISPEVEVKEEDIVIATGPELHHGLAERQILHLLYAGFVTNWCILGRDYGIRTMGRYGYNIIMLRDCTTGVEFPDTLDALLVTEISVREIEQQFGFSASNTDFFESCRQVE